MGYGIKHLQPGSLYITIAVPQAQPCDLDLYRGSPPANYFPYLPDDFDPASYETYCADGYGTEEFDWGLYWHRDGGDGTWYGLRRMNMVMDLNVALNMAMSGGVHPPLPSYTLARYEMSQSPRLHAHVIGLMRVLHVPDSAVAGALTVYLDWLAAHAATSATRSFIWATSLFLRTRRHIVAAAAAAAAAAASPRDINNNNNDSDFDSMFDITAFLWEALDFAYSEVWYGLAGQLPRPVMGSAFGVELLAGGEEANDDEDEDEVEDE